MLKTSVQMLWVRRQQYPIMFYRCTVKTPNRTRHPVEYDVQLSVAGRPRAGDHPLRPIRKMVNAVRQVLSPAFDAMYASSGRPSIAPEKLLKALLRQRLAPKKSADPILPQHITVREAADFPSPSAVSKTNQLQFFGGVSRAEALGLNRSSNR